jgi:hypothetical protein
LYRLKKILVYFSKSYALDPRALSLLRIGLAIVIITDLIIRAGDLSAHYTDEGVWPAANVKNFSWKTGYWTIHALSGSYWWEALLFAVHGLFAFFLLIGFRTRLSSLIVLLLYISLHNRNLFINQAGDDLIRLMLFWGLFLPWNSFYAVDSRKIKNKWKQQLLPNLGYLLLIATVYFFTVCLKYGDEWRKEYSAVYYALSLEQLRMPYTGDWLYTHPQLMKILTFASYYIELIIPVLILFPAKKGWLRLTAFFLLFCLHIGIGLSIYVGLFFIINIVTAIGLLPSFVMDWLEKKIPFMNFLSRSAVLHANYSVAERNRMRWFTNVICAVAIVVSLIVNLSAVKWFRYELADAAAVPVNALRFDQYWGMFSPNVLKRDGWYVYYGIDSIGRQWDISRNEDYVSFEKPKSIIKIHPTDRWRKLTENIQRDDMNFLRILYCKYKLRRWNREHPEKKLALLQLYYMQKESLPDYKTTPVEKTLYCICNDH